MPNKTTIRRMQRLVKWITHFADDGDAQIKAPNANGDVKWVGQPDWAIDDTDGAWVRAEDAKQYVCFYFFEDERHQDILDSEFVIGGWASSLKDLAERVHDADDYSPDVRYIRCVNLDKDEELAVERKRVVVLDGTSYEGR